MHHPVRAPTSGLVVLALLALASCGDDTPRGESGTTGAGVGGAGGASGLASSSVGPTGAVSSGGPQGPGSSAAGVGGGTGGGGGDGDGGDGGAGGAGGEGPLVGRGSVTVRYDIADRATTYGRFQIDDGRVVEEVVLGACVFRDVGPDPYPLASAGDALQYEASTGQVVSAPRVEGNTYPSFFARELPPPPPGGTMTASGPGDVVPAFDLTVTIPSGVEVTSEWPDAVGPGEDLEITWLSLGPGNTSFAFADNPRGQSLGCVVPNDAGGLVVPAELFAMFDHRPLAFSGDVRVIAFAEERFGDWAIRFSLSRDLPGGGGPVVLE